MAVLTWGLTEEHLQVCDAVLLEDTPGKLLLPWSCASSFLTLDSSCLTPPSCLNTACQVISAAPGWDMTALVTADSRCFVAATSNLMQQRWQRKQRQQPTSQQQQQQQQQHQQDAHTCSNGAGDTGACDPWRELHQPPGVLQVAAGRCPGSGAALAGQCCLRDGAAVSACRPAAACKCSSHPASASRRSQRIAFVQL